MSRILPILFNADMVRAILRGICPKTVTRRRVKGFVTEDAIWGYTMFTPDGYISCRGTFADGYGEKFFKLPYQPGDILYVRETWQYLYELDGNEQIIEGTGKYYYAATNTIPFDVYVDSMGVTRERIPWHPSIHMPKGAARIFLKVTDVRVERLQEITEEQAVKEGIYPSNCTDCTSKLDCDRCPDEGYDVVDCFVESWNSILKKSDIDRYGWDANPWVWVIGFERCEKPEGWCK